MSLSPDHPFSWASGYADPPEQSLFGTFWTESVRCPAPFPINNTPFSVLRSHVCRDGRRGSSPIKSSEAHLPSAALPSSAQSFTYLRAYFTTIFYFFSFRTPWRQQFSFDTMPRHAQGTQSTRAPRIDPRILQNEKPFILHAFIGEGKSHKQVCDDLGRRIHKTVT